MISRSDWTRTKGEGRLGISVTLMVSGGSNPTMLFSGARGEAQCGPGLSGSSVAQRAGRVHALSLGAGLPCFIRHRMADTEHRHTDRPPGLILGSRAGLV